MIQILLIYIIIYIYIYIFLRKRLLSLLVQGRVLDLSFASLLSMPAVLDYLISLASLSGCNTLAEKRWGKLEKKMVCVCVCVCGGEGIWVK